MTKSSHTPPDAPRHRLIDIGAPRLQSSGALRINSETAESADNEKSADRAGLILSSRCLGYCDANQHRASTTLQNIQPALVIRRGARLARRALPAGSSHMSLITGYAVRDFDPPFDHFRLHVMTAELPGVDEKDIKVSLDDNQLVISGEKKEESTKEEKDWHVEERSFGSFYQSMSLPFEPEDGAVDAHFDKGVLHLTIKKPAKAIKTTKTIEIKTGTGTAPRKAA